VKQEGGQPAAFFVWGLTSGTDGFTSLLQLLGQPLVGTEILVAAASIPLNTSNSPPPNRLNV